MKFKGTILFNFCLVLLIQTTHAFSDGSVVLEGTVKSFSKEIVELITKDAIYKIPRNLVFLSNLKTDQSIEINLTKQQYENVKSRPLNKK